jgi:hypothetical protein
MYNRRSILAAVQIIYCRKQKESSICWVQTNKIMQQHICSSVSSPPSNNIWIFEQVLEPKEYNVASKKPRKGLVSKSMGNYYVSEWNIHEHSYHPYGAQRNPPARKPRTSSCSDPVYENDHKTTIDHLMRGQVHSASISVSTNRSGNTNDSLYHSMFEMLVGKKESQKIDEQYSNSIPKQPRYSISISELVRSDN